MLSTLLGSAGALKAVPKTCQADKPRGGRLVISLRSEPKTLNPVTALDSASRMVIERMCADLLHIARDTQRVVPTLASSWSVSRDARHYTLRLREGVKFSDGQPFTADDVVFSVNVYLDERSHSPQRELLLVGGEAVSVVKVDSHTVRFSMRQPYAAGERLFDSLMILPRHLLQGAFEKGTVRDVWGLGTQGVEIAGLGPFTLRSYVPGQQIVLRRNPHYWGVSECGDPLPYLDELVFVFAGSESGQVMRFHAGEADAISRIGAENFQVLERDSNARRYRLMDLGPGLEYHFLVFNLNDTQGRNPGVEKKQKWFRDVAFRRAVSAAMDRDSIVKLVFKGRADAVVTHVTKGNPRWINRSIAPPKRSLDEAKKILAGAGYSWRNDGALLDRDKSPVDFTMLVNAGNPQRLQIATIVQSDLKQLGIRVHLATLESRSAMDRVFRTFDYDCAVLALAGGDADPNAEMNVWSLSGSTHVWNLTATQGKVEPWEREIDVLMKQQLVAVNQEKRKQLYDRVQELVSEYLPIICLAAPHVLVGAKNRLGNLRPAILSDHLLWNAEEIFLRQE